MAHSFLPGNLIASRTVYTGTAATVSIGQTLASGGAAVANGPSPTCSITRCPIPRSASVPGIYLDQVSKTGTLISTMAIDPLQATTSFTSKSELALNLTADGKSVTFMGYKSPVNALDVSNSNTPGVFDATNPVASTVQRAVVQVTLKTGAVQTTAVNAYSGNNGRAAVLANGNYYMVGNSGNGSGDGASLSQLSDNTGVQRIAVGSSSGATTAVGVAIGSYGSATGYQRGFSVAQVRSPSGAVQAADKTGKDDNFRGMTVFDNTLFVTKGSGSNGVNTVYQVGATHALAAGGTIADASIAVLPGFNTLSEKVAETKATLTATPHPFGLWFANSTTLFVADEGDGVRTGVAGKVTTFAGLQEWTLSGGTWHNVATFQKGLLDRSAYLEGGGASWHVSTDGLRNIAGHVNADGSFTIYGTTSTVSDELTHDLGADRNELVSITIGAGSTAANTSFSVLQTAAAGERLGGVALAVPEPETYALMLAGLAALGLVKRRRDTAERG